MTADGVGTLYKARGILMNLCGLDTLLVRILMVIQVHTTWNVK